MPTVLAWSSLGSSSGGLKMSKAIVTYYDVMAEMWCAYWETGQDSSNGLSYGFGKTEEQAIKHLKDTECGPSVPR